MSVRFRGIAGLHHGTQGETADDEGLIRACGCIQHMGEPAGNRGLGRLRQGQVGVGGAQGVIEFLQPVRAGRGVYAVEQRRVLPGEKFRHGLVGAHHERLDEPVTEQPLPVADARHAGNAVLFLHHELRFGNVEVQSALTVPALHEHGGQFRGFPEHGRNARSPTLHVCGGFSFGIVQSGLHLAIGEPCPGNHDGIAECCIREVSVVVEAHVDGHAASLLIGPQAAYAVAQGLGKHGLHGHGKIVGIAALAGLPVQCRSRPHVVGNVRNGHEKPPAFGRAAGVHGVVEVAGVLAVDGDQHFPS